MKTFIESQFPIARLSAESYKERKAVRGQTLTGLGKWWGRKPLILVRAAVLGMLMPASDDPKKDLEIFLKILTMDDDGVWQRCKGAVPLTAWREVAPADIRDAYFGPRGFKPGLSDEEREEAFEEIWDALSAEQRGELDRQRRRSVDDREAFDAMPYALRIRECERPEEVAGPSHMAWRDINTHLGTSATSLLELVRELGQRSFGHAPRVGDCFCGGGSIPFEAARIGCEAFGSDLNPVAGLLTWASLEVLGGGRDAQRKIATAQAAAFRAADEQITAWGIEHNNASERADAFLYCVEVKPEGCDYYIPLAPSWVVATKTRMVVKWRRDGQGDRLTPEVVSVSAADFGLYNARSSKKGATIADGRIVDPFDPTRTWSIEAVRGPDGLRRWTAADLAPRSTDVFQERLYCIRWIDAQGRRRYAAPTVDDLTRERKVLDLLQERFATWQDAGYIPSLAIPEGGEKTEEPTRTRGWTYWHHLFSPRQLLVHGLLASKSKVTLDRVLEASTLLNLGRLADWDSRLSCWLPSNGGGIGGGKNTFLNQALNPLFNFSVRPLHSLESAQFSIAKACEIPRTHEVAVADARDTTNICDLWITDPPYADAINYHELADFFLAWHQRRLARSFPDWPADGRAALAVRGDGDDFRRSMVEVYRNLARHMPTNGLQLVMFTHKNPAVWADLGMILWAAGLKVTAAWTVSTETPIGGIKKGNYVQGTVCLVLRNRDRNDAGFLDEVYPLVEDEVRRQIRAMQALDEGGEPNFNDADYQLAAYAAALKVLTEFGTIDGRDVEREVFAARRRNEKSDFQVVIERAIAIACDALVPKGLEPVWRDLSLAERYYLRALDIESRGERRKGMYEELARGFGLTDIAPLLKTDRANGARMLTPDGFGTSYLNAGAHPFAGSPLRHLAFAVRETAVGNDDPEPGRQYLRDTFGQAYWGLRERLILLLDWLAALGNAEGMEEWVADSQAARILAGRLRNDHG